MIKKNTFTIYRYSNSRHFIKVDEIKFGSSVPPNSTTIKIPNGIDLNDFSLKFNGHGWDVVERVPIVDDTSITRRRITLNTITETSKAHNTKITKLAFLQRFLESERITLRTLAKSNPVIEDYMAIVEAATYIDLSRDDTQRFVRTLEASGLIGVGRANTILDISSINPIEEYKGV